MNYIKHLTGFFERVSNDRTLNPTHISLYIALFQFWNCNRFRNPISISRDEIMRISKISSKATYHKCLKGLHTNGYIRYEPSYNPFRGSHVYLFNFSDDLKPASKAPRSQSNTNFDTPFEQAPDKSVSSESSSLEQLPEQEVVPLLNKTNNLNYQKISNTPNLNQPLKKKKIEELKVRDDQKEEKNSAKKEEILIPLESDVKIYFSESGFPAVEANKFFNYYQSIGWLVGGKTPMTDWRAAAKNWIMNAPKFLSNERTDATRGFDTSAGKDYSEPL